MYKLVVVLLVCVPFLGLVTFLAPYAYLEYQAQLLAREVASMNQTSFEADYFIKCRELLGVDIDDPVDSLQLRFESDRDYQIEVICAGPNRYFLPVDSGQLLKYVTKKPDSSGFVLPMLYPESLSTLTLDAFWATKTVAVVNGKNFFGRYDQSSSDVVDMPRTTCQGWGRQCCSDDQVGQEGVVDQSLLTDCMNSCYLNCQYRPVIVVFTTDPLPSSEDRVFETTQETITLDVWWAVNDVDGQVTGVTIDLGDGTVYQSQDLRDNFSHTWTCQTESCQYQATITAVDNDGHTNYPQPNTKFTIKFN